MIVLNPEVAALAKFYGFEENVEMGGAYFSRELANGDTLTISNGDADYPETPESPITWTVEDCHDGSLTFGDASSFRKFLEML
jgi:hypothetical protein